MSLPKSGTPALKSLIDNASKSQKKVWAADAPFSKKDALKDRGYHWHDPASFGKNGKCWAIVIDSEDLESEQSWLQKNVFSAGHVCPVSEINATNRHLIEGS